MLNLPPILPRLKASEIKAFREELLKQQGGRSALSGQIINPGEAVTDHDHKTGQIRGVITRAENSVLGKVENGRRFGRSFDPVAFAAGLHLYLTREQHPFIHPTHGKTRVRKK